MHKTFSCNHKGVWRILSNWNVKFPLWAPKPGCFLDPNHLTPYVWEKADICSADVSKKLKANKQHSPNGEITVGKSKSGVNCPFDWMSTKEKEIIH